MTKKYEENCCIHYRYHFDCDIANRTFPLIVNSLNKEHVEGGCGHSLPEPPLAFVINGMPPQPVVWKETLFRGRQRQKTLSLSKSTV